MGKNRPTQDSYTLRSNDFIVRGPRELAGYISKWVILCAGLSYIAMTCWNILATSLFHLPTIDYLQAASIWVLLSLIRVAINGLQYLVVHPR